MNGTIADNNWAIEDTEISTIHACNFSSSFFNHLWTKYPFH